MWCLIRWCHTPVWWLCLVIFSSVQNLIAFAASTWIFTAPCGNPISSSMAFMCRVCRSAVAAAIISELESDPAIEAVTSVKLDREENGVIRVRLTLESWVRAGRGGRGR